MPVTQDVLNIC